MATERKLRITAGKVTAEAILNDSPTATKIWEALPIEARGNTWGDEIYFSIPVDAAQAKDARDLVAVGELGYWSPGTAFCIFFGRTPASTDERPRAASPVNILGAIQGDATVFRAVASGTRVRLERA
jgi:uncharacterized protein